MTALLLRALERIHGHLGWLTVLALLHPAILLRDPRRRARLSVGLSAALVALTSALGAFMYPEYRARLKQHIFLEAPRVGWLFERKEHLAVGALIFALTGTLAHVSVPIFADEPTRRTVARLAHRSYVLSFLFALAVASLGVVVAVYKSF